MIRDTTPATLREVGTVASLIYDAMIAEALTGDEAAALVDALGAGTPDRSRLVAVLADLRGHHLTDPAHPQLLARAEQQIRELAPKGAA